MSGSGTEEEDWRPVLLDPPRPGLVLCVEGSEPLVDLRTFTTSTTPLRIAREGDVPIQLSLDTKASAPHADVAWDGERATVTDLGSANGTFVDGVAVVGTRTFVKPKVLRTARSLFLFVREIQLYEKARVLIGKGEVLGVAMQTLLGQARKVIDYGFDAMLVGESGVGKERVARWLHDQGPRAGNAFVAANCATLVGDVGMRALFGSVKGAYTGATSERGFVMEANHGTLFLDEIGDLPMAAQTQMFRVLQEREVTPVGATRPQPVDVRVVVATNIFLPAAIDEGRFRKELYQRVANTQLRVPPLSDRLEEIPSLVEVLISRMMAQAPGPRRTMPQVHAAVYERLMLADWKESNVRGLGNALAQALVLLGDGPRLTPDHFPHVVSAAAPLEDPEPTSKPLSAARQAKLDKLLDAKKKYGSIKNAAESLGMEARRAWELLSDAGLDANGNPKLRQGR